MKYCKECNKKYKSNKYLICPMCGEKLELVIEKNSKKDYLFCKINSINHTISMSSNSYSDLSSKYSDEEILENIKEVFNNYRDPGSGINFDWFFKNSYVLSYLVLLFIFLMVNQLTYIIFQ